MWDALAGEAVGHGSADSGQLSAVMMPHETWQQSPNSSQAPGYMARNIGHNESKL